MTSSTTIKAVEPAHSSDGATTTKVRMREYGLTRLREREATGLISLACEAQHQAGEVSSELHKLIYEQWDDTSRSTLEGLIAEARACMQTAEHYLLMLGSVNDEREDTEPRDQDESDPGSPGEPPF